MLNTLRQIVQEVNTAKDLPEALEIIVERVRDAMQTEVCSVYLVDRSANRYLLMATQGLNKRAVGTVSLGLSEGLVGLIGLREEPINLDDAPSHPSYYYLPETGEEPFHAFLGVPIIHQRKVLGVLIVQQRQTRSFDESEEAFLVTMSAQLAGVIAHAEASGGFALTGKPTFDLKFTGISGAPGVAIGQAVVIYPPADLESVPDKTHTDADVEYHAFLQAVDSVRDDLIQLNEKLKDRLSLEERMLFEAYLRILEDHVFLDSVKKVINEGQWAQGALRQVIHKQVSHFSSMEDDYLRERAADIRDLGRRILAALQHERTKEIVYPPNTILIGEELTPSILGDVPEERLAGMVSLRGSRNSHIAILARAIGVPTIMGAIDLPFTQLEGKELILDGNHGVVLINVSSEINKHYRQLQEEEQQLSEGLEALKDLPCETPDSHRVPLWVNTGLMSDVARSLDRGAEGVGLYRTEVAFMIGERFPSEEEQRKIYREQLEAFHPKPVTMRTLDIGGDKGLAYFPINETNPVLGWRGIRVTLDHPEIFMVQMRAMLKASVGLNNMRVMFPMITNVAEVEEAMHLAHRAYCEVVEEGFDIKMPPIGVMVEVPAAVYQVRELAKQVDFISVGSNDLTQYLLAVDRDNPRVSSLFHSLHPAVLRALQQVVSEAHEEGVLVSICGEIAGDPAAAVLLMAMGYDVLSMNATSLPKVKWVLRNFSLHQAKDLLDEVMQMDNALLIRSCLNYVLREAGFEKLIPIDS